MIDEFIAARRARWERLEALLGRQRRRRGPRLSPEDLETLGRVYRQSTSDLAIARRDFPFDQVTRYLEQLVGRAHPMVYRSRAGSGASIRQFFARDFPRSYRAAWRYTLAAFALFAVPFLLLFLLSWTNPTVGRMALPPSSTVDQIEQGRSWMEIRREERGLASSFIMTNNIRVIFLAFGGGALFGLGTVFTLISNGVQIGAVAGMAAGHGLGSALASFVAPHGGIELSVIFIAGGAGLRLGHALLAPGLLPRRVALAAAARQAMALLLGCVPLLVVAGTIEGLVSPSGIPLWAKFAVGALALAALYGYLLGAGREPRSEHA